MFVIETSRTCSSGMKSDPFPKPDSISSERDDWAAVNPIDSNIIAQTPTQRGGTLCVTAACERVHHAPPPVRPASRGLQVADPPRWISAVCATHPEPWDKAPWLPAHHCWVTVVNV